MNHNMKNFFIEAIIIMFYLLAFITAIYIGVVFRFQNPTLTETQLFLATWKLIVIVLAFFSITQLIDFFRKGK